VWSSIVAGLAELILRRRMLVSGTGAAAVSARRKDVMVKRIFFGRVWLIGSGLRKAVVGIEVM